MKSFKSLSPKEKFEYIGILAIYPLILLFEQMGKSVKFLNIRKRQIIASVLTVCMLVTMLPVMGLTAFATQANVASVTIGGTTTEYDDFQKAIDAAEAGGTSGSPAVLKLLANIPYTEIDNPDHEQHPYMPEKISATWRFGGVDESIKYVNLDMNGHSVSNKVELWGTVMTISGNGTFNGTASQNSSGGCLDLRPLSKVTIENGTFNNAISMSTDSDVLTELTINGGTFDNGEYYNTVSVFGNVTINGGNFIADNSRMFGLNKGNLSITGGNFACSTGVNLVKVSDSLNWYPTLSLSGGTYTNGITLNIANTDGTVTYKIQDILAENKCYFDADDNQITEGLDGYAISGAVSVKSATVLYPYVDADGVAQTPVAATVLSGIVNEDIGISGQETWYIVTESATIAQYKKFVGTVNLILADGATLTSGMTGTSTSSDTLIIWGQENGTGRFNATGGAWEAGIQLQGGSLIINGGNIIAQGGANGAAGIGTVGHYNFNSITINAGNVTATGTSGPGIGQGSGTITITGGTITATGNGDSGSLQTSGTISLSGGTFPNGLSVNGETLDDALTNGYGYYQNGALITLAEGQTEISGSVTVETVDFYFEINLPAESMANQTLTVNAVSRSDKPISYQWYKGSEAIPGATDPSYTPAEEGQYSCVATCEGTELVSNTCQVTTYGVMLTKNDGTQVYYKTLDDLRYDLYDTQGNVKITLLKDASANSLYLYDSFDTLEFDLNGCELSVNYMFWVENPTVITDSVGTGGITFAEGANGFEIYYRRTESEKLLTLKGGIYKNGIKISHYYSATETLASILGEGYGYYQNGELVTLTEGQTEIPGSVTVKKIPTHSHEDVTYDTAWSGEKGQTTIDTNTNIVLTDTTTSGSITISSGVTVNLCLNGCTLDLGDGNYIQLKSGATLNICDCGTGGTITSGTNTITNYGGTVNVTGGTIRGVLAISNNNGGEPKISGTVHISGGAVIGTSTGISNGNGNVTISGGIVTGEYQGITNSYSNSVTVTSGTITGKNNYGIYNVSSGDVRISGGTITGKVNGINNNSGNIYLSNTPTISGNTADLYDYKGKIYGQSNASTPVAYTGEALTVQVYGPTAGDVIIHNATTDKFSVTNEGYILAQGTGDNAAHLVLAVPHSHVWDDQWSSDGTAHWHECTAGSCDISENNAKDGYQVHTAPADDGDCTTAIKCADCEYVFTAAKDAHTSTGENVATYTKKAVCDECGKEYGEKVADDIAPTGEIKIGTNGWLKFWYNVSFGLFCKDYVEIEVIADDAQTGIDKIEYYLSDSAIDGTGIKDITDWTEYTDKIKITAEDKRFVYAKITDKSSNVTYLSVDGGVVVFKDTEVISGEYEYTLTTKDDIVTNIKPGNNTVSGIDICIQNGGLGSDLVYSINNDGYIVLDGADLEEIVAGKGNTVWEITISYNALGEVYGQDAKGDKITDTVLTLTVKRCKVEKPTADNTVFTYNGTEQTYTVAESEYYTVTGNKRTNAGEQDVTVALNDTNTYEWADSTTDNLTFEFNIGKKALTVTAKDNTITYGDAPSNNGVAYSGFVNGETKTVLDGTLGFDYNYTQYGNVGNNYTITPKGLTSNNYEISFANGTLTVEQKEIGIEWTAPSNLIYDGTAKVPTAKAIGVVNGDAVNVSIALTSGNDNVNAGTFTYYATGIDNGNYKLPSNVTSDVYTIVPKTVTPTIEVTDGGIYDGTEKKPTVVVKDGDVVIPASEYTVAYTDNLNAGTATVTITDKEGGNYTVNGTQNFTISKADPTITWPENLIGNAGDKLSTVALEDGFTWDNGETVIVYSDNNYGMTYTPADTNNYNVLKKDIKVNGLDVTFPTAEISLKENKWTEFWNNVTFGLFFKDTQEISITADDTESGVKEIAYYLSAEELSADDVKALGADKWTVYTDKFSIEPDNKYVVYARITDNAGNITYLNSDGIVLDSIKPVIAGIENGKDVYGNATFTVDENNLDSVTLDGEPMTAEDGKYVITADNAEHKVVVTDKSGNKTEYTLTVYKNYTVTYMADGKIVGTETVGYGKDATLPEVPEKDGYTGKWNADGKNITADTTITAEYTKIADKDTQSPATGDNSNIWLWIAVMFVSGVSLFGIVVTGKRKKSVK